MFFDLIGLVSVFGKRGLPEFCDVLYRVRYPIYFLPAYSFFQSSLEFLDMLCFSALDSFTYRFLALSSADTIDSMVSSVVKLVDAQLISSAYYWSTIKVVLSGAFLL